MPVTADGSPQPQPSAYYNHTPVKRFSPSPQQNQHQHPRPKSNVHRSLSLRSELSNNSQQSKRVSFNRDVHIKRIPRGYETDPNGKLVAVLSPPGLHSPRLWVNEETLGEEENPSELYNEAKNVLKLVENLSCSTSPSSRGIPSPYGEGYSSLGRPAKKSSSMNLLQRSPSKLSEFFRNSSKKKLRNSSSRSSSVNESLNNLSHEGTPFSVSGDEQLLTSREWEVNTRRGPTLRSRKSPPPPRKYLVQLNSIGETSTSGSDEVKEKEKGRKSSHKQETSESPISSLSGPEDGAGGIIRRYANLNLPPSSGVKFKVGNGKTPPQRPPLPKFNSYRLAPPSTTAASPFSRISPERSNSTLTPGPARTNPSVTASDNEGVVYAQVMVADPRNGFPAKRTVHRTVGGNQRILNREISLPAISRTRIRESSPAMSDTIITKPKNVTILTINSGEEPNGFHSNGYTAQNHNSSTKSADELEVEEDDKPPERTFFYGDSITRSLRDWHLNSSRSPYLDFSRGLPLPTPARSPSTRILPSSKLVRDVDTKNRNNSFISSAKLVNTFGPAQNQNGNGIGRVERNNKLNHNHYEESPISNGIANGRIKNGSASASANGLKNGFANHSSSLEILNNHKKSNGVVIEDKKATAATTTTGLPPTGASNGLISTLMRRNKDKETAAAIASGDKKYNKTLENGNKNSDLHQSSKSPARAKFLSGFLEKNFTLRRNGKLTIDSNNRKSNGFGNGKETAGITLNSNHVLDS